MKTCKVCKIEKELSDFQIRKDTGNPRGECKSCRDEYAKQRRNKIKISDKVIVTEKECNVCFTVKPVSEYHKDVAMVDGHFPACKACRKGQSASEYERNKEEHKSRNAKRYAENPEHRKEINNKSNLKHREKVLLRKKEYKKTPEAKKLHAEWVKNKKETDPTFIIKHSLRNRLNKACKAQGVEKIASAIEELGCSPEELWIRFESQFEPGMTRHNRGKYVGNWSIDHILPMDYFDLSDPDAHKIVNHYLNLKPMWVSENSTKNNKITVDPEEHINKIKQQIKLDKSNK
jgi:hypothetical protein